MAVRRATHGADDPPGASGSAGYRSGCVPRKDPGVEELIAALEVAELRLGTVVPSDTTPRVGADGPPQGRVYLDHARDIGTFNPCFPLYDILVDGDTANGSVTFPLAYEGPPGLVHGGFIALFFDCIIQHHNCDLGRAGKTTSLAVQYRRPTPLNTNLRFSIQRSEEADRIISIASLIVDERPLCIAEMSAAASDRSKLPTVSPRRSSHGI